MSTWSAWKVLGGVAAGVGTMAALPVVGPAGVLTAAGAAVGGAAGALVGFGLEKYEESQRKAAYNEGYRQGAAEAAAEVLKHRDARKEDDDFYQLILAMVAMGLAAAACDGEVSEEESEEIQEFSAGVAHGKLPKRVRERIAALVEAPPNLATAMEYVEPLPESDYDTIELVIRLVIESDGIVREAEAAFLEAWRQQRSAA